MSLKKASITWNANQIAKMVENGKIAFDNVVQRSYVWEPARRSKLITSMIIGFPIPPIYSKRGENRVYDILEGQQRLVTVTKFLNDEFKLTNVAPFELMDEATDERNRYDISGLKFSELPEELKEIIKTCNFTIYYFDDITQEEIREMFQRLNNGKPLSTKEKNIAYCNDIANIMELGKHNIFHDMLTKKAYESKSYVSIIAKMYQMMTEDIENISFVGSKFNPYIQQIKIDPEEAARLQDIFDSIELIHDTFAGDVDKHIQKIGKKIYKEIHLISLVPFTKRADEDGVDIGLMIDWIRGFYEPEDKPSVSDEYNIACIAGTAKPENIQKRYYALEASFNEFFKESED